MMNIFRITYIAVLILQLCESSRILIIHTTVTKSHLLSLQALVRVLAEERQHDVTFMSAFPMNQNVKNLREFAIPYDEQDRQFIYGISESPISKNPFEVISRIARITSHIGNSTLQSKEMKYLMKNEKFDLIILGYYMNGFMLGLGDHFKCPTIIFSPSGMMNNLYKMTGNPYSLASSNHFLLQGESNSFSSRLNNFLVYSVFDYLILGHIFEYHGRKVYNYNFPSNNYRSYSDSLTNVSLVLLNSHFSTVTLRPLLPNVVEAGGLQLISGSSPLPEKLKTFLDSAQYGAIFFSLGSKVDLGNFPNQTMKIILKVFSKLDQKVIMKWGTKDLQDKPQNVFIGEWLPQNDILAHPNVKIFISHCGINGIVEAQHHGVPIIATPLYSDQFGNAKRVENDGWGRKIDLKTITESKFMSVIQEILTNSSYAATAKKQSALQADRPQDAKTTAVYWIEYVVRHHGAPHLHYQGAELNILQKNSLDVIGFLMAVFYVTFKVIKTIARLIWNLRKLRRKVKLS